jgi:hypothetical protein
VNSTDRHDALVDDYLRRLEGAAYALTPERRAELVLEIRDHIADARTSAEGPTDEAWTRTLLDRLGTPEEIVAAASESEPPPPPPAWTGYPAVQTIQRPAGTGLELAAVLLLTVGSVLPVIGWLVGVICLWSSRRWRTWEKLLGTLVIPGGPLGVLVLATVAFPTQTCSTSSGTTTCTGFALHPGLGIPVFLFVVIAPIVVAGWLYSRARARAALEPPVEVVVAAPRTTSPWGGLEIAAVVLLAAGAFVLPGIGPVVGLVLAWSSTAWTTREKWVATAIAAGGLLIPLVLLVGFAGM